MVFLFILKSSGNYRFEEPDELREPLDELPERLPALPRLPDLLLPELPLLPLPFPLLLLCAIVQLPPGECLLIAPAALVVLFILFVLAALPGLTACGRARARTGLAAFTITLAGAAGAGAAL